MFQVGVLGGNNAIVQRIKKFHTMLYYNIRNYTEFREIFGTPECRRNKILLSQLRNRKYFRSIVRGELRGNFPESLRKTLVSNATGIECLAEVILSTSASEAGHTSFRMFGCQTFGSATMRADNDGLCEDGDAESVRYENLETGKLYKMKATKFFRRLLNEAKFGYLLSDEAKNYYAADVVAKQWKAWATTKVCGYTLKVGNDERDFAEIYDYFGDCIGYFGSCMQGAGHKNWHFYFDSVKADAVSLWKGGKIYARAILYKEVEDQYGNGYRLLERQYSQNSDESLKRILIQRCISEGLIDGYKRCGASCHESTAWMSKNGEDWSDKIFSIECNLNRGDYLSYQDSFKYYDESERRAYNDSSVNYDEELDSTELYFGGVYDEYHDTWCESVVRCLYEGRWVDVDSDDLDDFIYCDNGQYSGEYVHEDDVTYTQDAGYVYYNEATYSHILEENYFDEEEMKNRERKFKEDYWHYSSLEDEYFENSVSNVLVWNERAEIFSRETASEGYISEHGAAWHGGELIIAPEEIWEKINNSEMKVEYV